MKQFHNFAQPNAPSAVKWLCNNHIKRAIDYLGSHRKNVFFTVRLTLRGEVTPLPPALCEDFVKIFALFSFMKLWIKPKYGNLKKENQETWLQSSW